MIRHRKPLIPRHQQIMLVLVVLAAVLLSLTIWFQLFDAEFRSSAIFIYGFFAPFVAQSRLVDMNRTPVFLAWTAVGLVHFIVYLLLVDISTTRLGDVAHESPTRTLLMLPIWLPIYWLLNRLTVLARHRCLVATGKMAMGDSEEKGNWWDVVCNMILFFVPFCITIF